MRYHQAILISCEIPWDEEERLMEDVFRQEVRHALGCGFRDVYIFGTAGEGYGVDRARFERIVSVFREETLDPAVHAQVGVIGLSTVAVVERLAFAYEKGFRVFQITLPCWGVLNDGEVMKFFRDVCGRFPDARFLHYNLMRSKRMLTPSHYRRLADEIPNLAATKNTGTTAPVTAELMRLTPEIQHFFGEAMFPIGCLYGECSLLSSFGPMAPTKTKEFFEYGRSGQIEKLFSMQKDYLTMMNRLLAPMLRTELIDGAYDKMLVRLAGLPMPLRLLSPYECLTEEVYVECSRILREEYPAWLG